MRNPTHELSFDVYYTKKAAPTSTGNISEVKLVHTSASLEDCCCCPAWKIGITNFNKSDSVKKI